MGSGSSKTKGTTKPTHKDFELLACSTCFSVEELKILWNRFEFLRKDQQTNGIINMAAFKDALGLQSEGYTHLIFSAFDTSGTNHISFTDFVQGLSSICPRASTKEKAKFVFNMFDMDKNGVIDKNELQKLLDISLGANSLIKLPQSYLDKIIDNTFAKMDHNNDGMITLEDFEKEANQDPSVLSCLSFSIDGLFPTN